MVQATLWDLILDTDKRTDQPSRLNFFSYDPGPLVCWPLSSGARRTTSAWCSARKRPAKRWERVGRRRGGTNPRVCDLVV